MRLQELHLQQCLLQAFGLPGTQVHRDLPRRAVPAVPSPGNLSVPMQEDGRGKGMLRSCEFPVRESV